MVSTIDRDAARAIEWDGAQTLTSYGPSTGQVNTVTMNKPGGANLSVEDTGDPDFVSTDFLGDGFERDILNYCHRGFRLDALTLRKGTRNNRYLSSFAFKQLFQNGFECIQRGGRGRLYRTSYTMRAQI